MADTEPVTTPQDDMISKESFEAVKAKLEELTKTNALLKNKVSVTEERQRAQLAEMAPAVQEWIAEAMETGSEYKHEMAPMQAFGESLTKDANVDSALPLARMVSCFSAKVKREREEFSKTKDSADLLAEANKQIDTLTAERDAKATRIAELETLSNERQQATEKLTEELAKAGVLKEKYDFSVTTSRENNSKSNAEGKKPAYTAPVEQVDPLLAFVSKAGGGSSRINLSGSSHHILGSGGGADAGSLASAIRQGGF